MRGALIFLCLTLWATAEARPQTADDAHFEGQKARLESLKQKLSDLKNELDERLKRVHMVDDEMDLMEQAIIQAESTGCEDDMQFQCGGHHPKCISRLLVCDSYADCDNEADENEQCRVYTPGGSIWEGRMEADSCTSRHPKEVRVTIDSYKIIDYLRSFPEVTATIDFDPHAPNYDPATSLHVNGHMDLMVGDNRLYFSSHEKSGLAFECIFDGIDDHHCHGRVLHESSQLPCAYFTLHRVDSYGEDHEHA